MATREKQKKGGFMSALYKPSSKNRKPKTSEPAAVVSATRTPTNNIVSKPVSSDGLLVLRQLESSQDIEQYGRRIIDGFREGGGGGGRGGGGSGEGNVVAARKSVSHVETNLSSVAAFLQVKVLVSDMPGFMQVHAFRCARRTYDSLEKFSSRHMAYNMKKEFDKVYGPAWHCIVGSSFGSFVTHSTGCFLYFTMEKLYILVFKTKVQKALKYTT